VPWSREQRAAAAAALERAAELVEARAGRLQEVVDRWRKDRPRDTTPHTIGVLRSVSGDLRRWAEQCRMG
jgi:hypothetical protein